VLGLGLDPDAVRALDVAPNDRPTDTDEEPNGLGLGFFIAKTLLERSGATLSFENRAFPDRGAMIKVRWRRNEFERPLIFAAS